jgi:hypothetical protein
MICTLYHQAQERHERGIHLVSTDEKTGIQALERNHPDQPAAPGRNAASSRTSGTAPRP